MLLPVANQPRSSLSVAGRRLTTRCNGNERSADVTHGLVIRQMLMALPQAVGSTLEWPRMGNTALSIFDASPPHTLRLLNCVRHLDAGLIEGEKSLSGG
jgi:hypothetical protein